MEMTERMNELASSYGIPPEEAFRYSMWRPKDTSVSTIVETNDQGQSYYLMIHDDELSYAVASFLEQHGSPVFSDSQQRTAYTKKLEQFVTEGLSLAEARNAALSAVGALPAN